MNNKILASTWGGGEIVDVFKQADYWMQFDSFTYKLTSTRFDTYYTLYDLDCREKSDSFISPYSYCIDVYSLNTFDVPYCPNIWLYSANLSSDKTYTSALYLMDYVFTTYYLGKTVSETLSENYVKGGEVGGTMACSSSYPNTSYIAKIFDDLSNEYAEGEVISIPILVASWSNGIPQEVKDYEAEYTPSYEY